jgi:hypothetical protein
MYLFRGPGDTPPPPRWFVYEITSMIFQSANTSILLLCGDWRVWSMDCRLYDEMEGGGGVIWMRSRDAEWQTFLTAWSSTQFYWLLNRWMWVSVVSYIKYTVYLAWSKILSYGYTSKTIHYLKYWNGWVA